MALALGKSAAWIKDNVSEEEFRGWMAFARLEPFGPLREASYAGTLAAIQLNANRDRKRHPRAIKPEDVFLELSPKHARSRADTDEEIWNRAVASLTAVGATISGTDRQSRRRDPSSN